MPSEQQLKFLELRKREIDLARAMINKPDDVATRRSWYAAVIELDELYGECDPVERSILDDLQKILSELYPSVFIAERLIDVSEKKEPPRK